MGHNRAKVERSSDDGWPFCFARDTIAARAVLTLAARRPTQALPSWWGLMSFENLVTFFCDTPLQVVSSCAIFKLSGKQGESKGVRDVQGSSSKKRNIIG